MRIEAYNQIQQMYKVNKVNKAQTAYKAGITDQVSISSFGKEIQAAKAAVTGAPDIREELTAPVKARIQNGTYEVSNESFAEKLMQKYAEMR